MHSEQENSRYHQIIRANTPSSSKHNYTRHLSLIKSLSYICQVTKPSLSLDKSYYNIHFQFCTTFINPKVSTRFEFRHQQTESRIRNLLIAFSILIWHVATITEYPSCERNKDRILDFGIYFNGYINLFITK